MNSQATVAHISKWLLDYAKNARTKGFVVGISGGIDSAVTSTLCALTGLPTLCVEMPIHQVASQVSRGRKHIHYLKDKFDNVTTVETDLTTLFDQFMQAVGHNPDEMNEMSAVNTRARLRMTTLYYHATKHGYLVAGTGNKVEDFGVGFFTKYGDGGVDLSPIADLVKTEVYEIAKHLNITEDIIKAPPTDGLWGDDRTDEDQIGASYPELEWAMKFKGSEKDITNRQKEVLTIYRRLNLANQHKMKPIPVCIIPDELR